MKRTVQRRVVRPKRPSYVPFLTLLASILVLIGVLTVSFLFFLFSDLSRPSVDRFSLEVDSIFQKVKEFPAVGDTAAVAVAFSQTSGQEQYETEKVKVDTLVPKSPAASDSYFDDAIFIGDSISVGLRVYGVLPTQNVLAEQNVNILNLINGNAVYTTTDGQKSAVLPAIDQRIKNPGKIYILIGANGIPGLSNEAHIKYYAQFIDQLQEKYPDAMIYAESVTPITADSKYIRDSFTTEKINDFNDKIYQMAQEKGIYYLNVQEVLMDDTGHLISDYDAGDGMHLKSNGHKAMYEYYLTHTVDADGYANKIVE